MNTDRLSLANQRAVVTSSGADFVMNLSAFGTDLEVLPPVEVLTRVIDHNAAALGADPTQDLVEVRIVIAQTSIVGRPLKIDTKKNVVIATDSGLAYVNVTELSVVEVLDPDLMLSKLAGSVPSATPVVPAASPPRQKLRDQLSTLNSKFEKRFRLTIEADVLDDAALTDAGKNQFTTFLGVVEDAFDTIGATDVGEITISSLDRVALVLGNELAVKRSGSVMVIAAPFNTEFAPTLRAQLDTMLELNL